MPDMSVYLVVDDDALRRSLTLLLHLSGYRTVRSFASAEAFLPWAEAAPPGCLLLDYRLPDVDGLELLRRLKEQGLTMPIVMMTGFGDVPFAVRAMRLGAFDILEKPFEREGLMAILREAERQLPGPRDEGPTPARKRVEALTRRERDVLNLLVAGLANKAIAHDLGISPRTVEVHRAHIMNKVGARNFSTLLQIALEAGVGQ